MKLSIIIVIAVLAGAAAMLGLVRLTDHTDTHLVVPVSVGPTASPLVQQVPPATSHQTSPAPSTALRADHDLGSRAWLIGAWGPVKPAKASAVTSCDTDDIVVFSADGTYRDGGSYGRFRYDGHRVTYYNRILVDQAEETEDRSEYDLPHTATIKAVSRNVMTESGNTAYRCDAG